MDHGFQYDNNNLQMCNSYNNAGYATFESRLKTGLFQDNGQNFQVNPNF